MSKWLVRNTNNFRQLWQLKFDLKCVVSVTKEQMLLYWIVLFHLHSGCFMLFKDNNMRISDVNLKTTILLKKPQPISKDWTLTRKKFGKIQQKGRKKNRRKPTLLLNWVYRKLQTKICFYYIFKDYWNKFKGVIYLFQKVV